MILNHLLSGYLGGLTFALLTIVFTLRSGGTVPWRIAIYVLIFWPVFLPLFCLFPANRMRKFRA